VIKHGVTEADQFRKETFTSRLAVNTQTAEVNWSDNKIRNAANEDAFVAIEKMAVQEGWPTDVIKVQKLAYLKGVHKAVLNQAISQDTPEGYLFAEAYFKANEKDMDQEEAVVIQEALDNRKNKTWTRNKADEIRLANGGDLSAQMTEAAKITDATQRAQTEALLKADYNVDQTIRTEGIRKTKSETIQGINSPGMTYQKGQDLVDSAMKLDGVLGAEMQTVLDAKFLGGPKHTSLKAKNEAFRWVDGEAVFNDDETAVPPITSEDDIVSRYSGVLQEDDIENVIAYYKKGGGAGELTHSKVESVYKKVTTLKPDKKLYEEQLNAIFSIALQELPPGKLPTEEYLKSVAVRVVAEGEAMGIGTVDTFFGDFGFGYDENMTYLEAKKQGKVREWQPLLSDSDTLSAKQGILQENARRAEVNKKLEAEGVSDRMKFFDPSTDAGRRFYWKHLVLGIKWQPKK